MRIKNVVKNIKYNFIFLVINLFMNFIFRSIFIKMLGDDIAGFNSLMSNLMGFLNIAELGVASAVTYSLYKPLKNREYNKINEIMVLFKYYYRNIAKIILVLGILLGIFLTLFIKDQMPILESYIYYGLFLINTVITYIYIYKQTLIIADQKQYIVVSITNLVRIIKLILQIIIISLTKNYLYFLLLEIIFNILGQIIINKKADRIFKEISFKCTKSIDLIKEENMGILKNIKNIFFHKTAEFLVFRTDGIIISIFLTLKETAIYANYMLIIGGVLSLVNGITTSFTASIGNLVVEDNSEKNYKIFKKLYLSDHFIAIIISFCLYKLINRFTIIWLGREYLFNETIVLLLIVNVYIQLSRGTIENFKNSYGLFWDKYAPIIEGMINLMISVILIKKMGILGLLIGTFISNIVIILIWKPYLVYKYGFKINPLKHIKLFINMILTAISIFLIADKLNEVLLEPLVANDLNFFYFIGVSIATFGIVSVVALLVFILKKDFREMLVNLLGNRNKKVMCQ